MLQMQFQDIIGLIMPSIFKKQQSALHEIALAIGIFVIICITGASIFTLRNSSTIPKATPQEITNLPLPTLNLSSSQQGNKLSARLVNTDENNERHYFSKTDTRDGFKALTGRRTQNDPERHNFFDSNNSNVSPQVALGDPIQSSSLSNGGKRFWIYEYSGNESQNQEDGKTGAQLFDGKFWLSKAQRDNSPQYIYLHNSSLTFTQNKRYYLMTEEDLCVSTLDADSDNLNDQCEADLGTDKNNSDTDGGGTKDGQEVLDGTDPDDSSDDVIDHRINPLTDLEYLGAFRMPNDTQGCSRWSYGGYGMSHYPDGDSEGNADEYSGSLFVIGQEHSSGDNRIRCAAEIGIPEPVISQNKNVADLPRANTIQDFTDLTEGEQILFSPKDFLMDMEPYQAQGNQVADKLYWTKYIYYQPPFDAYLHGWSELDFSNLLSQGLWRLGDFASSATSKYLFRIPKLWADTHVGSKYLAAGRKSAVNRGTFGPALYAFAPWNDGNPPADSSSVDAVQLLYYPEQEYPVVDYSAAEEVVDGAWITTSSKEAVIFTGMKGVKNKKNGLEYYEAPTVFGIGSKGNHADPYYQSILFYDPDDFVDVIEGVKDSFEPQPYVTFIPDELYAEGRIKLGGAGYDSVNNFLYIIEQRADGAVSRWPLVHVYKINEVGGDLDTENPAAPSSVRIIDSGCGYAEITWDEATDNDRISGYIVYRDHESISLTKGMSFKDKFVSPNNIYKYTVAAIDRSSNIGPESVVLEFDSTDQSCTDDIDPYIYGRSIREITPVGGVLRWKTDEPSTTELHVYDNFDKTVVFDYSDLTLKTDHEVLIDGLNPNRLIIYTITATDAVGNSLEWLNSNARFYTANTVPAGNQAPVLTQIGDKNINYGETLEFTITGSDPENKRISFFVDGLPEGAVFNPKYYTRDDEAWFGWTPRSDQNNTTYDVKFIVSDGNTSTSETITITVGVPSGDWTFSPRDFTTTEVYNRDDFKPFEEKYNFDSVQNMVNTIRAEGHEVHVGHPRIFIKDYTYNGTVYNNKDEVRNRIISDPQLMQYMQDAVDIANDNYGTTITDIGGHNGSEPPAQPLVMACGLVYQLGEMPGINYYGRTPLQYGEDGVRHFDSLLAGDYRNYEHKEYMGLPLGYDWLYELMTDARRDEIAAILLRNSDIQDETIRPYNNSPGARFLGAIAIKGDGYNDAEAESNIEKFYNGITFGDPIDSAWYTYQWVTLDKRQMHYAHIFTPEGPNVEGMPYWDYTFPIYPLLEAWYDQTGEDYFKMPFFQSFPYHLAYATGNEYEFQGKQTKDHNYTYIDSRQNVVNRYMEVGLKRSNREAAALAKNHIAYRPKDTQKLFYLLTSDPTLTPESPSDQSLSTTGHFRVVNSIFMRNLWDGIDSAWAWFQSPTWGRNIRDLGPVNDINIWKNGGYLLPKRNTGHDYWGGSRVNTMVLYDESKPGTTVLEGNVMDNASRNFGYGGLGLEISSGDSLKDLTKDFPGHTYGLRYFEEEEGEYNYMMGDGAKAFSQNHTYVPYQWVELLDNWSRQFVWFRNDDNAETDHFVVFDRVGKVNSDLSEHLMFNFHLDPEIRDSSDNNLGEGVIQPEAGKYISKYLQGMFFQALTEYDTGITIEFRDPGTADSPISLSVNGKDIVVSLATDSSGNITSNRRNVVDLINANAEANVFVKGYYYSEERKDAVVPVAQFSLEASGIWKYENANRVVASNNLTTDWGTAHGKVFIDTLYPKNPVIYRMGGGGKNNIDMFGDFDKIFSYNANTVPAHWRTQITYPDAENELNNYYLHTIQADDITVQNPQSTTLLEGTGIVGARSGNNIAIFNEIEAELQSGEITIPTGVNGTFRILFADLTPSGTYNITLNGAKINTGREVVSRAANIFLKDINLTEGDSIVLTKQN